MLRKNQLSQQKLNGTTEKKKAAPANFEDIMSRFLKDSEERQQDFKKHQEFKAEIKKKFLDYRHNIDFIYKREMIYSDLSFSFFIYFDDINYKDKNI